MTDLTAVMMTAINSLSDTLARAYEAGLAAAQAAANMTVTIDGADYKVAGTVADKEVELVDGGFQTREMLTCLLPKDKFPTSPVKGEKIVRGGVSYYVRHAPAADNPAFWRTEALRSAD